MATQGIGFGAAMASSAAAVSRSSFELQFSQLQNTVIRRLNDEIKKANEVDPGVQRRVDDETKQNKQLSSSLKVLAQYHTGVNNILSNLEKMRNQVAALMEVFGTGDQVTQGDVDAFNQKKAALRETLNNLPIFKYAGIQDGNAIEHLKQQMSAVDGLNAVVGTADDNQETFFKLLDIDDQIQTGQSVMTTTLGTVYNLQQDMQAKIKRNAEDINQVNQVDQQKKLKEVEDLKARYGQLLQAISMSFEVNQDMITSMGSYLSPQTPPAGSVLNLFS